MNAQRAIFPWQSDRKFSDSAGRLVSIYVCVIAMYNAGASTFPPGFGPENPVDPVYQLFRQKVDQLLDSLNENPSKHKLSWNFAGFVVQRGEDDYDVVAIGCGSGHLMSEQPDDSHGTIIHDCHAMVLAKRSLQRYLFTLVCLRVLAFV